MAKSSRGRTPVAQEQIAAPNTLAEARTVIASLPADRWPAPEELAPLRRILIDRARDEGRMPRRSGWGLGPTELQWIVSVIASGIIGNFAYASMKALVARISAKWVANDPDEWLRKLASESEWEELRVLRHPGRPAELYVEERFAERAEARLIELQTRAARDYPKESPPQLRTVAPQGRPASGPRAGARPRRSRR